MKRVLFFLHLFLIKLSLFAQTTFSNDPLTSPLVTTDLDNFFYALDASEKCKCNTFDSLYLQKGSMGVKDFTPQRIVDADELYSCILQNKQKYLDKRKNVLELKNQEKKIRATFFALAYLYPEVKFPPVYFVFGRLNSGGTSSNNGLIIGMEMQASIESVPSIVAHELIHFQQKESSDQSLLAECIKEGSADFIGQLISGGNINNYAYAEKHKDRLCKEFVKIMYKPDLKDWLYGNLSGKDDRPTDVGYWMGYKITESYFNKALDKKKAIADILNIKDFNAFLVSSGYLNSYLKK